MRLINHEDPWKAKSRVIFNNFSLTLQTVHLPFLDFNHSKLMWFFQSNLFYLLNQIKQ